MDQEIEAGNVGGRKKNPETSARASGKMENGIRTLDHHNTAARGVHK
jgi:hypothetical protein